LAIKLQQHGVKNFIGELSLALKSGNFGDEHFFAKAQSLFE